MIVKEPESNFQTVPAGVYGAVCVDEVDLGMMMREFNGEKREDHMVRLVWQISEYMRDGKPFQIKKEYAASLHEKANLRKDLEGWRGRAFTADELTGFDLEAVVGKACLLNIVHKTGSKGGVFANVASITPLAKGFTKLEPYNYTRAKDRKLEEAAPACISGEINDEDIPF